MTVSEFYSKIDGDYNRMLNMLKNDKLIKKFVIKFLDDQSYHNLMDAVNNGDLSGAFKAAHTLKGVTGNLSFTMLYKVSSEITELLRQGNMTDAIAVLADVQAEYEKIADAIKRIDA